LVTVAGGNRNTAGTATSRVDQRIGGDFEGNWQDCGEYEEEEVIQNSRLKIVGHPNQSLTFKSSETESQDLETPCRLGF
jgi:hypothetical protein